MHPIFWVIIVLSAIITFLVLDYEAWRRIFPSALSRRFQRRNLANERTKFRYSQKVSAPNNHTLSKPSQTAYSSQVAVNGGTSSASPPPGPSPGNNMFEPNLGSADKQTLIKHSQKDNLADKETLIRHPQKDNPDDEQTLIRHPQKNNPANKQTLIRPPQKDNPDDEQTLIRHPQKDNSADEQTQFGRNPNNAVKPEDEPTTY